MSTSVLTEERMLLEDALGLLWPPDPRWASAAEFYAMTDRRGEARGELLRQWEQVAEWEDDLEAYAE